MRKRIVRRALLPVFILATASLLTLFFLRAHTLIALLFEDGSRELITLRELEALEGEVARRGAVQMQRIPKIIHQTYRDENVPGSWKVAQRACVGLHGEWEYMVSLWGGSVFLPLAERGWVHGYNQLHGA
jgi:inositol phosphorylceramide mannosyltransferase catalytic subunit